MKRLTILALLLFPILLIGQEMSKHEVINLKIDSDVYGSQRDISIYLPLGYDTTTKYTVAYLFDGQAPMYLPIVSSIMEYYWMTGYGVQMIIVSIHTQDRWKEFIPPPEDSLVKHPDSGYANLLSEHLAKEVIPLIESKYKTLPFRLGIGHSLGGSYVLYELFKPNSLFQGGIVASPNLTGDNERLLKIGQEYYRKFPDDRSFIYATVGDQDFPDTLFRKSLRKFDEFIQKEGLFHLTWQYKELLDDDHMMTFPETVEKGLIAFTNKWYVSDDRISTLAHTPMGAFQAELECLVAEDGAFKRSGVSWSASNVRNIAYQLSRKNEFHLAVYVMDIVIQLAETENIPDSLREFWLQTPNLLGFRSEWHFMDLVSSAKREVDAKQYDTASKLYREVFAEGLDRNINAERFISIGAFAQAGYYDDAFEQLLFLAEKAKWQGSNDFEKDPLMEPLYSDPRWKQLMLAFERNVTEE